MAIFYEGIISSDSFVTVTITPNGDPVFILEEYLQYGYKLYGEGYNLGSTLDTDCLAAT